MLNLACCILYAGSDKAPTLRRSRKASIPTCTEHVTLLGQNCRLYKSSAPNASSQLAQHAPPGISDISHQIESRAFAQEEMFGDVQAVGVCRRNNPASAWKLHEDKTPHYLQQQMLRLSDETDVECDTFIAYTAYRAFAYVSYTQAQGSSI